MPKKNSIPIEKRGDGYTNYPGVSKTKDGYFTGRFQHGVKPNGKPKIYTVSDKSSARACFEKLQAKKADILGSGNTNTEWGIKPFGEVVDQYYMLYKEKNLRPNSRSNLKTAISILKQHFEFTQIKNITSDSIQEAFNKINEKYSLSLSRRCFGLLNQTMKWMVEKEAIGKNPCVSQTLKPPSKQTNNKVKEIKVLDIEDVEKFETQAVAKWPNGTPKYENGLYLLFLFQTALRASEASGLKWSDVNFTKKELHVQRQLLNIPNEETGKGSKWFETTNMKTERSNRKIHLTDKAVSYLRELDSKHHYKPDDYIFLSRNRLPVRKENLRRTLNHILKAAETKIQDIGLHAIRHTAICKMFYLGMDVLSIAQIAGHSPDMTMKVYLHLIKEMQSKSYDLMEQM